MATSRDEVVAAALEVIRESDRGKRLRMDIDEEMVEWDEGGFWRIPIFVNRYDGDWGSGVMEEALDFGEDIREVLEERLDTQIRLDPMEPRGG